MEWLYYALGSILFFTSLNLLQRALATESINQKAMSIVFNSYAVIISLILFILGGAYKTFTLPTQPRAYFLMFIAVLFYGLFERYRFVVAKLLEASVFSTVSTISLFVAFTGSALLYQEPMTINKILGGLFIIVALILISYNKKITETSTKGLVLGSVISIILGIGWMCDKSGTIYFESNTYNLIVWTLPLVVIIFPGIKVSILKQEIVNASWKIVLLAGFNVVGYLLQLQAISMSDATRVIPIVQLSTLLTILLGIIILKEREHMLKKITAGFIALLGVILLVT